MRDTGIVNICYCLKFPELPLKGNYDESKYKLYFFDTGIFVAMLDEEAQEDLRANKNLGVYKGALYENIVGEALTKCEYGLYYYKKDDSYLEEDFFVRTRDYLLPVEVKATRGTAKSLRTLIKSDSYPDIKYGIKFTVGTGGMKEDIGIFDTVVCTSSEFRDTNNEIYSDFPIMESPIFNADSHLLEIARSVAIQADWKIHFGLATTGDIFTKNISPDALCIDMETAAAAHTCYMCNVPFIAIRSISDNKADNGQEAINRNFDKAAYQSCCLCWVNAVIITF